MSYRIDQVNELIKEEMGVILQSFVNDKKLGIITITRVDTSSDLARAKVWISIINSEVSDLTVFKSLEKRTGYHFILKSKKNGTGSITIKYSNKAEFNDIYEYLLK